MALDPYVTLADLADFMELDEEDLPAHAEFMLDAAMQAVRKFMDQDVTLVTDDVETHDGRNRLRLRLKQRPVREVYSVVIDDEELDDEAWQFEGAVLLRIDGELWPAGWQNIVVTYDHGWDIADDSDEYTIRVPADIRLATLSAARRFALGAGEADDTIRQEAMGSYSYSRSEPALGLIGAEQAVLKRYIV